MPNVQQIALLENFGNDQTREILRIVFPLLKKYKLTNRISSDLTDLDQKFYDIIDYQEVEQEAAHRRSESMQYLSSMILSANEHNK